jgi:hypothetical protein
VVANFSEFINDPIIVAALLFSDPFPHFLAQLVQPSQSCALILNVTRVEFFLPKCQYVGSDKVKLLPIEVIFDSNGSFSK